MSFGAIALGGTALVGSVYAGKQAEKGTERAVESQERGQQAAIAEQRDARHAFEKRMQPFIEFGLEGRKDLLTSLGLGPGRSELERRRDFFIDQLRTDPARADEWQAQIDYFNKALELSPDSLPDRPDLAALPPMPTAETLPAAPTAFDPRAIADNPMYDFLLEEGFRGIEERGAGGGRNVDRDLVRFAQGTAATVLPQLQAQQFQQQSGLRGQALSEQLGLRGQALSEQAGLRADALSEQQQRISNLLNTLGIGQAAAAGVGKAGIHTAGNIGTALGNIGATQALGALGKAQARGEMTGNIIGSLGMFGGMFGGGGMPMGGDFAGAMRPQMGGQQLAGPFNSAGLF